MAQSRERKINFGGFLQPVTCGASFGLTLGAGQIDNVQFADFDVRFALVVDFRGLDRDGEDGVGAGRVLVHVGLADVAHQTTLFEHLEHVLRGFHDVGGQVFDVDASVLVFKFKFLTWVLLVHQVADLLIVNFQVRNAHQELTHRFCLDKSKNVLESTRHQTLQLWVLRHARDCESLASASLTISENGAIVALNDILTNGIGRLCEDVLLFAIPIVN